MSPGLRNVPSTLDYQGESDERTWYMREKVLEDALIEMRQERDYLREMLRAALTSFAQTERDPA